MRRFLALLLFAPVGLLACATGWQVNPSRDYAVVINGMNEDQSAIIMGVASEWQTTTNGFVTFHGAPSSAWGKAAGNTVTITINGMPGAEIQHEDGEGVLGYQIAMGEDSYVQLPNDAPFASLLAETTRHELGHTLGLKHTGAGTIMCADIQCAAQTITCADVQQLAAVWGCYEGFTNDLAVCDE